MVLNLTKKTYPIEQNREEKYDFLKGQVAYILGDAMVPVIACESHFNHWDANGNVLLSPTNDVGIAQINLKAWSVKAKQMGLDLFDFHDNLAMAKYILQVSGKKAWVCTGIVSRENG